MSENETEPLTFQKSESSMPKTSEDKDDDKNSSNKDDKDTSNEESSSESDSSFISTSSKRTKSISSIKSKATSSRTRLSSSRSNLCHKKRTCCGVFLCVFKVAIIVALLILLSLLAVGYFLARLEFQCSLDKLSPNLYSSIYGQDVAIKRTLDSVTNFCSGLTFNQPLTLVFWGPTGVGKTSFATIFTDHFDPKGHIVPAEHFKASKYKDWYGNRDQNKPFVYTVDDVATLEDMQDIATNMEELSFPLILAITTSMESNLLNQSFIEWSVDGKSETDFTYTGEDPTWLRELEHLSPVIVPFLPLSRTNIKLCIEKTLNNLKMKYTKDDIERIANEFEYFHNDKRLFSKIGCKRVNDKIFSVLSP